MKRRDITNGFINLICLVVGFIWGKEILHFLFMTWWGNLVLFLVPATILGGLYCEMKITERRWNKQLLEKALDVEVRVENQ